MRVNKVVVGFYLTFIYATHAMAIVRSISVDENTMAEIHLSMGRSTVLHFMEKPTKVVSGNQNYFNIEFTGNDITIQPLGFVTSNLFVYGEYRRYGFTLKVIGAGFDDLVNVRSKSSVSPNLNPLRLAFRGSKRVTIPKTALVTLTKSILDQAHSFLIIELEIADKTGRGLDQKSISFSVIQGAKPLPIEATAFDLKEIEPGNFVTTARVFVKTQSQEPISLATQINGKRGIMTISTQSTK